MMIMDPRENELYAETASGGSELTRDICEFWDAWTKGVSKMYIDDPLDSITIEIWPGRMIFIDNAEPGEFFYREERYYGQIRIEWFENWYFEDLCKNNEPNEALLALVKFVKAIINDAITAVGQKVFWKNIGKSVPIMAMPFDSQDKASLF